MAPRLRFFATCAPGVEPLLHAEIRALKLSKPERQVGGVYFEGRPEDAWRANLWLRTAVRVLQRVARFPCETEDDLYRGVGEVDWSNWLLPEGRLVVDAHAKDSALSHSRYLEQRTKDAIVDQFRARTGARPSVDREDADLGVNVHLFRDRCTVLVDTSGGALHRRGWRRTQGRAPLAETLAAAVILASDWDRRSPFLDPFCGSGTLLVEAAMLADNTAPGLRRSFGFERWPGHRAKDWARLQNEARAAARPRKKLVLQGSDIDPERLRDTEENLVSADLADRARLECVDATALEPRPGWNAAVVSNLPYGERVGHDVDLERLYRAFGETLRERCRGFRAALLTPAGSAPGLLRLPNSRQHAFVNGGIDTVLTSAELPD